MASFFMTLLAVDEFVMFLPQSKIPFNAIWGQFDHTRRDHGPPTEKEYQQFNPSSLTALTAQTPLPTSDDLEDMEPPFPTSNQVPEIENEELECVNDGDKDGGDDEVRM